MKVLFVTPWLAYGGAERQTITLANRLAERGHDCELAYIKDEPSQLERLGSAVPSFCLQGKRYLDPAALRALARRIRDGKPSQIVAMNQYGLFYAWMAKRLAASLAPLTVTFHTTVLMTLKEKIQLAYYKPLFRSSECLVYVCEGQKRYWVERGLRGRRSAVIYNGVDLEQWKPVSEEARRCIRAALDYAPRDFVIGLSAVLHPEKRLRPMASGALPPTVGLTAAVIILSGALAAARWLGTPFLLAAAVGFDPEEIHRSIPARRVSYPFSVGRPDRPVVLVFKCQPIQSVAPKIKDP